MAGLAGRWGPQSAPMMAVLVTRRAGHTLGRKTLVDMAGTTLLFRVFAQQRKAGQRMVKADIHGPTHRIVTPLTIAAQLARMHIFLGMAGATLGGQLDLICRLDMARLAPRLCVFADKRKIRHAVMVEVHRLPSRCGVAATAIRPISAFMNIIGCMAI